MLLGKYDIMVVLASLYVGTTSKEKNYDENYHKAAKRLVLKKNRIINNFIKICTFATGVLCPAGECAFYFAREPPPQF